MFIQVMAYFLYLLGQCYFFFTLITITRHNSDLTEQEREEKYFLSQTLEKSLSSLSQIILCYVFWSIHKLTPVSEEKNSLDEDLDLTM
jgi:hypothetical protein